MPKHLNQIIYGPKMDNKMKHNAQQAILVGVKSHG